MQIERVIHVNSGGKAAGVYNHMHTTTLDGHQNKDIGSGSDCVDLPSQAQEKVPRDL